MPFGLRWRDQLPAVVVDEFENLISDILSHFSVSHDEDGNVDTTVIDAAVSEAIDALDLSATPGPPGQGLDGDDGPIGPPGPTGGFNGNGITGSVVFIGPSSTLAQDSANFVWDNTNKRLVFGTVAGELIRLYDAGAGSYALGVAAGELAVSAGTGGVIRFYTGGHRVTLIAALSGDGSTFNLLEFPAFATTLRTVGGTSPIIISEVIVVDAATSNLVIGPSTTPLPGAGSRGIILTDGVPLSSMGSNTAGLYADDVAGTVEVFAINEAGVATQLTGNSGVYTPTLTNVANLSASTAYECQWLRVGKTVTVSGKVDIDPVAGATLTQLGISIPVTSNFGATEDCSGVAFASRIAGQGAGILADTANDRAQLEYISGDVTNQPMHFTFSYQVI